jgi:putative membrane protein
MVRDSAAETLPFSQIGGFVVGVRAAILDGFAPAAAAASMIADITTEMVAQLVYVSLGIALLGATMKNAAGLPSTGWLMTGISLAALAAASFCALQRYGSGMVRFFTARFLPQALEHTDGVTSELRAIYRAPERIAASFLFHLVGWITSGASTWIAFRLLGAHTLLSSVIAIDSLVYAIRSVAFAVPNALGIQEAAYAMFAPVLGVGPEIAIAISLLKRGRDVAIGIPVLLLRLRGPPTDCAQWGRGRFWLREAQASSAPRSSVVCWHADIACARWSGAALRLPISPASNVNWPKAT